MEESPRPSRNIYTPLLVAVTLAGGVFLGKYMAPLSRSHPINKIDEVLNYIEREYVDTISEKTLEEDAINATLQGLDPHSFYIPAEELQGVNEPLEGEFDGIGVEFHVQEDTIMVVTPISGGPSESLGIQPGDRIVKVNGENVAGIHISNKEVMQKLRGKNGTRVKVSISRRGHTGLIEYTITRGKIPLYSVDFSYMIRPGIGYIKISRFAENTYGEFMEAMNRLGKQGMQKLILDLRSNPGGYLNAATRIADEFLDDEKEIVYTEGKARPKTVYNASSRGVFEKGSLSVLIDEGSASASEIVAGALQDWDRALIIGRRSFGKGLVQDQVPLGDGSALRLTIARYYTPSGRCIQKSYKNGLENYQNEVLGRMRHGELESADSISLADTVKHYTRIKHRIVYAGGGIMPDIFVPVDTSRYSAFYSDVLNSGTVNQFVYDYVDKNRAALSARYHVFKQYMQNFSVDDVLYKSFLEYAGHAGMLKDEHGMKKSSPLIRLQLKALIARQLWGNDGFYPVIQQEDNALRKAIEEN